MCFLDNVDDCGELNGCSGHGICTDTNVCKCDQGWLWLNCSKPDCSVLNNCNNHGICIGPSTCRCTGEFALYCFLTKEGGYVADDCSVIASQLQSGKNFPAVYIYVIAGGGGGLLLTGCIIVV